jgi:peptidoglycan/LPS O-acetylase OafA/YrhL
MADLYKKEIDPRSPDRRRRENESQIASGRNSQIDLLRFIGLSMIILAHVYPPAIVFQIRNFDVPLMIIVAGMSFSLVFRGEAYGSYIWRRVKRLLFPVWIFLTVYYLAVWSLGLPWELLDFGAVVSSYLLFDGIGFVWIIRVFLIIALLAPYIHTINKAVSNDAVYILALIAFFSAYELLRYIVCPDLIEKPETDLNAIFLSIFPYTGLFALGLRLKNISRLHTFQILFLSFAAFMFLAFSHYFATGNFVPTQAYKYPPSMYYLSYAIFMSVLLWCVSGPLWNMVANRRITRNLASFIAQHTIWIYLWHIPLLYIFDMNYGLKFILVFSIAIAIVYMQRSLIVDFILPKLESGVAKKNVRILFLG